MLLGELHEPGARFIVAAAEPPAAACFPHGTQKLAYQERFELPCHGLDRLRIRMSNL